MSWLWRCVLALASLPLTLAALPPAGAQTPQQTPPATPERAVAGLPLYTSDGKAIGKVLAIGLDEDDKPVLVAEIARTLGFGLTAVAVPSDMFVRKADRIELTITAAEVDARLEKAR